MSLSDISDVPAINQQPVISPTLVDTSTEWSTNKFSGPVVPTEVEKRWGRELLWHNKDYCLKTISIKAGHSTSMHFHKLKTETLLVLSGQMKIVYLDREGNDLTVDLSSGDAFHIESCLMHRLVAVTDVILVEGSSVDAPHDSFRVSK